MQIRRYPRIIHKLYASSRTQECLDAYRQKHKKGVNLWERLKEEGVSKSLIQNLSGISRASYYRHKKVLDKLDEGILPPSKKPNKLNKPNWGEAAKQLVLKLRRESPTYGKEKIAIIINRDHNQYISESRVGRILTHLREQGLITRSLSALRPKRKRTFRKHVHPWTYKDYKTMSLGERIHIDHMTVSKNGIVVKHFQAWDRKSKHIFARVYSHAKASSAKRFLLEFVKEVPFPILSIQVDGASEFRAEFEEASAELTIPLIVLPPQKPECNGGVERGNRTFREEFYRQHSLLEDSVGRIQAELCKAVSKYNSYRPHRTLKGLTPLSYIHNYLSELNLLSHST